MSTTWQGVAPGGGGSTPKALWAHYKLCRYHSVLGEQATHHHWRSHFSRAVSAAACGNETLMHAALEEMEGVNPSPRIRHELATSLAAFAPCTSLIVLAGEPHSVLKSALLEKTGEDQHAISILTGNHTAEGSEDQAERILLRSNLLAKTGKEKLKYLNNYLARFKLDPLTLVEGGALMPCPQTLHSPEPLRHFNGPLVSVIVATYNGASRLEAALRSLLNQTYRPIEIIVIDDCSTDNTADVVRHLQAQHDCIRYRRLTANVGPYVAKNLGMKLALGPFVTCHDSDDWSHPRKITAQMAPLLRNRYLVATASRWVRLDDAGKAYARSTYPLRRLNPSSILFRKDEVSSRIGLWDSSRTGGDSEFLARIKAVFGRKRVRVLAAPLAFGAHRSGSLMTSQTTGMDTGPMNPERLAYWQAWSDWHITTIRDQKILKMPEPSAARPFRIPTQLENSPLHLSLALKSVDEN